MRMVAAYDISARIKYLHQGLAQAAEQVIMQKLPALGGSGGIIGIDHQGNIIMIFNTEGMYRGYRKEGERSQVFIYRD
jgi:beta-aspartyl-peptidase (threonine type)